MRFYTWYSFYNKSVLLESSSSCTRIVIKSNDRNETSSTSIVGNKLFNVVSL